MSQSVSNKNKVIQKKQLSKTFPKKSTNNDFNKKKLQKTENPFVENSEKTDKKEKQILKSFNNKAKFLEGQKSLKYLFLEAIKTLDNVKGSSVQAIIKYVNKNYNVNLEDEILNRTIKLNINRNLLDELIKKEKSSYKLTKKGNDLYSNFVFKEKLQKNKKKSKRVNRENKDFSHINIDKLQIYNADKKTPNNEYGLSKEEIIYVLKSKSIYRAGMSTKSKSELAQIAGIKSKKNPDASIKEAENIFREVYPRIDYFDFKKYKQVFDLFRKYFTGVDALIRGGVFVEYKYGRLTNKAERVEFEDELKEIFKRPEEEIKNYLDNFTAGYYEQNLLYKWIKHFNSSLLEKFDDIYEKYSENVELYIERSYERYKDQIEKIF